MSDLADGGDKGGFPDVVRFGLLGLASALRDLANEGLSTSGRPLRFLKAFSTSFETIATRDQSFPIMFEMEIRI